MYFLFIFVDALIIITPPVIVHRMISQFGYGYNDQYEQAHCAVAIAKRHAALVKLFQDDEKIRNYLVAVCAKIKSLVAI